LGSHNSPKQRSEELIKFFPANLTTEVNKNETLYKLDWHPCILFLCNISDTYQNTHIYGTSTKTFFFLRLKISASALSTYDKGTIIRYGPLTLFLSIRYVISAIV